MGTEHVTREAFTNQHLDSKLLKHTGVAFPKTGSVNLSTQEAVKERVCD